MYVRKPFRKAYNLQTHRAIHGRETNDLCCTCEKSVVRNYHGHKRRHTKVKALACYMITVSNVLGLLRTRLFTLDRSHSVVKCVKCFRQAGGLKNIILQIRETVWPSP
uniref:C2H2-type domain-containing protein n=1 Tax=Anguilla anguilla TaxID=7936 RepID=A0A0E9WY10_ANGAN